MKKRIFTILLGLGIFLILLVVVGFFYVQAVLKSAPALVTNNGSSDEAFKLIGKEQTFLEGGYVNQKELKSYYTFSNENLPFYEWEKLALGEAKISKVDDGYKILKTFTIAPLLANDCAELYCYGHRAGFSELPSLFWKTLISIEDTRYLEHSGVDIWSMARAVISNMIHMRKAQGASTLTQQVVKNLFLNQEKTYSRKIKEIIYSIYLETQYSKDEILEVYLNEMYWGVVQGIKIKGVTAASLFYFGKSPKELSPFEVSILISLLKGAAVLNPASHTEKLKGRSEAIFKKLIDGNIVSSQIDKVWDEKDWKNYAKNFQDRENSRPYFFLVSAMNRVHESFPLYESFVFEKKMRELLTRAKEKSQSKNLAVKAIWGNPFDTETKFSRFYSKGERPLPVAIEEERHSIGSTIKPILYHFFLKHGKKMDDEVKTTPFILEIKSGAWSPKEAHEIKEKEVTLKKALQDSLNRPVIFLSQEVGFDKMEDDLLPLFGDKLERPLKEFPAQLLGTVELSLKEVFDIYRFFLKAQCEGILKKDFDEENSVIEAMIDPNLTTVRHVVKGPLKSLKFFGKTGTTNNGFDNWYVAYDGKLLGIIWLGLEGERKGKNLGLYGSTTAFEIYQNYIRDRGLPFEELNVNDSCQKARGHL